MTKGQKSKNQLKQKKNNSAEQASSPLARIRQIRLDKVKKLREMGIDPYPARSQKDQPNQAVVDNFSKYEGKTLTLTGRLMSWREMGKLVFADLRDDSGKIQIYIKAKELVVTDKKEQTLGFSDLNLFDIGDFIEVTGEITKSKRGEISILAKKLRMLTKAIRPLPEKWKGLQDKEERFRRRYLDMTISPEIRQRLKRRSIFWQVVRQVLLDRGFYEINIPVLEIVPGGADAKPFITHYDALDQDFYLRISHELPLKRLLGGGFEKVFDIGPRFRNEGFSEEHLPEHVAMEWYWAYAELEDGMQLVEEIINRVVKELYGKTDFNIREHKVSFGKSWQRISLPKVIKERFGVDIYKDSVKEMYKVLLKQGVELDSLNRSRVVDNLWKVIRKDVAGPAFLIDHPKFLSPLSKSKRDKVQEVERFQPLLAGSELGNGWSELNDPIDQYERFSEQQAMRDAGDEEAQMMDIDFVEMLEYGMPPAVGFGFSERVFWFLEDVTAKEAVPFPHLRSELDSTTKEIYHIKDPLPQTSRSDEEKTPNLQDLVQIDPQLSKQFSGIKTGYIILEGVRVQKQVPQLEELKKEMEEQVKSRYKDKSQVKESANIKGFRKIYKASGVDPNSRLNSAEALIQRVVSGKGIYNVNNVVDTYNLTSAELELPMAAYDLDQVQGKISLRLAKEGETIVRIGESNPIKLKKGEVVYADEKGITCMDFNYRDADRTKITNRTKRIIVFVDGHQGVSEKEIKEALDLVGKRLEQYSGGKVVSRGYST